MKLLLISRDFPNMFGGVSDYTYHLSRALAEKGEDVYVLTSKDERVIVDMGNNVKVLPEVERWGFRGLPKIIKEIRKVNPDWVLLQYVPYMYSHYGVPLWIILLVIFLKINKFKLLTTFHEVAIRFDFKKTKYWGIAVMQRLIAYVIGLVSFKIIVSINHYKNMLKIFSEKISVIPVGSSILPINLSEKEKFKLRNKIAPNGEFIITTFATGVPKGSSNIYTKRHLDIVIRGVKEYCKQTSEKANLIVLGKMQNELRKALEELIVHLHMGGNVIITGFLKNEDLFRLLSISDVLVLIEGREMNNYSGISTKSSIVAAAYAAGLPIIGNNGELTDNFFRDGENVILIGEKGLTPQAIAQKIQMVLNDKSLLSKLRKGSKKTYEEYLSWDAVANRYIEILK